MSIYKRLKEGSEKIVSGAAKAVPKIARGAGKATAYAKHYGMKAYEKGKAIEKRLDKPKRRKTRKSKRKSRRMKRYAY